MLFNFMCYEYYKAVRPKIRTVLLLLFVFVLKVCLILGELQRLEGPLSGAP